MKIEHGGNLRDFAKRFQISESEIIDFSSNINPLGISESVRRLYLESADELSHYPDPSSAQLCREITKHFSVKSENVIVGNGSMALLGLAVRVFAPKRALVLEPCFSEYRRLLKQQDAEVHSIILKEENNFDFKLSEIIEALATVDLLILGHPNNPTGTALGRLELLELVTQARHRHIYVIVDEAFADWSPEISIANEATDFSNLIVVRSLTKFFALAGIRSGFALGALSVIDSLKNNQETWSVNSLAEKLSIAALQDKNFQIKTRKWFQEESLWFYQALESLAAKVYPSLANFFLLKMPAVEGRDQTLFEFLGSRGLFVRPAKDFMGLNESYYRAALRTRQENEYFFQALNEWLQCVSLKTTL